MIHLPENRSRAWVLASSSLLLSLWGCDADGLPYMQNYDDGELLPAEVVNLDDADAPPLIQSYNSDDFAPFIGELGPPDPSSVTGGGATTTFVGTGGTLCVVFDPQTVWRDDFFIDGQADGTWNNYTYDDGDADMRVGLSANYTGTPGVEMGSFESVYIDPLGTERTADLNLCYQPDINGYPGGTAGRATPESCSIDTQEGVSYTVVLKTYAVPLDDNRLKFALALVEGDCGVLGGLNECVLRGDADPSDDLLEVGGDFEAKYCLDEIEE